MIVKVDLPVDNDLAGIIDPFRVAQEKPGITVDQSVEVRHDPALVYEGDCRTAAARERNESREFSVLPLKCRLHRGVGRIIEVMGAADDRATVIDRIANAVCISGQGADIYEAAVIEESVLPVMKHLPGYLEVRI